MFGKFIKIFTKKNPPFDPNADELYFLNHYGNIIDKKNGKAYKSTDERVIRKIEYTRYELTDDNKILDKVTNKEYDDLEGIVLLLNAQNQFIDNIKDTLDDEIQALNRAARYESEVGSEFEDIFIKLRDRLKKIQKELFSF